VKDRSGSYAKLVVAFVTVERIAVRHWRCLRIAAGAFWAILPAQLLQGFTALGIGPELRHKFG
jgi:hypothetical protein